MTLKNIFTLAVLSLLINRSGAFAADNSAVVGKGDADLHPKLAEWERFYNFSRPHGAH